MTAVPDQLLLDLDRQAFDLSARERQYATALLQAFGVLVGDDVLTGSCSGALMLAHKILAVMDRMDEMPRRPSTPQISVVD